MNLLNAAASPFFTCLDRRGLLAVELPVDSHELGEAAPLGAGSRGRASPRQVPCGALEAERHLIHDEQRGVAELLLLTSLDRKLGALLCRNLPNKLAHERGNVLTVAVETIFPQQTSIQQTLKLCDRANANGFGALGGERQESLRVAVLSDAIKVHLY